jgi:hypothetical protein
VLEVDFQEKKSFPLCQLMQDKLNWFDNQLTAIELLVNIASEIGGVARMK